MALENAKEFLKKAMTDETLRQKIVSLQPDEVVFVAAGSGYEFTAEELEQAENELRQLSAAGGEPVELDTDDLDKIAGGEYWEGDDAPDGHEMGCYIFYHGYDYSVNNRIQCTNQYYVRLDGCSKIEMKEYWRGYCKDNHFSK